ncbi:MAG: hypothetical protein NVSMB21_16970 [Vulcanimicrobiaceae bacterium]
MLERVRVNLPLKLLSLAIALLGWAYLRLTPNPVIAARFVQQISVPIATTGLAPDEIARFGDRTAVVSIDVPRAGSEIRPEMVRAVLDLEGRKPGVYNVPVEVIAPKFEIKSLSPASVTLSIERIEERSFAVAVRYTGDARRGIVVSNVALQPAKALLRGPTSELGRVHVLRVDVPLASAPATLDAMVRPVATDERGNELGDIAVSPSLLRVRARFARAAAAR